MVLDPIPQSLPVHFFGSRPQPPTSRLVAMLCAQASFAKEAHSCRKKHVPVVSLSDRARSFIGCLRLEGSLKLWVYFAKEPYKRDYILQNRPNPIPVTCPMNTQEMHTSFMYYSRRVIYSILTCVVTHAYMCRGSFYTSDIPHEYTRDAHEFHL